MCIELLIMKKLTIPEYAKQSQIDESIIYRHILAGNLKSELINDILHVVADDPAEYAEEKDASIARLQEEVEYMRKELETRNEQLTLAQTELSEARKSHDTIVQQMQADLQSSKERSDVLLLQLTQQLDNQTKLLEDMRQRDEQKKTGFFQRLFKKRKPFEENGATPTPS